MAKTPPENVTSEACSSRLQHQVVRHVTMHFVIFGVVDFQRIFLKSFYAHFVFDFWFWWSSPLSDGSQARVSEGPERRVLTQTIAIAAIAAMRAAETPVITRAGHGDVGDRRVNKNSLTKRWHPNSSQNGGADSQKRLPTADKGFRRGLPV